MSDQPSPPDRSADDPSAAGGVAPDAAGDLDPATQAAVDVVDDARRRLDALPGTPVAGHVPVFDEVHDVLQSSLAGLDER